MAQLKMTVLFAVSGMKRTFCSPPLFIINNDGTLTAQSLLEQRVRMQNFPRLDLEQTIVQLSNPLSNPLSNQLSAIHHAPLWYEASLAVHSLHALYKIMSGPIGMQSMLCIRLCIQPPQHLPVTSLVVA